MAVGGCVVAVEDTAVEDAASVLGVGCDVVDVPAFREEIALPGSRMGLLFSVRERRQCRSRALSQGSDAAMHLAARWAGKESVIKAWCQALGESDFPYSPDDVPWSRIEILGDRRSVPHVVMDDVVRGVLRAGLDACGGMSPRGPVPPDGMMSPRWRLSLSHDGDRAMAFAVLSACRLVAVGGKRVYSHELPHGDTRT
ncbi:holo-ACP synthase [Bifidobacterium minimum]|nr:4'-phosphopantetheinyl transferase superfamily protein [Bifidobacterium minimum]